MVNPRRGARRMRGACLVEEDLAAGDGDVEEEVEVGDGAVPPRPLPRRRRRRGLRLLLLLLLLPAISLHGWLCSLAAVGGMETENLSRRRSVRLEPFCGFATVVDLNKRVPRDSRAHTTARTLLRPASVSARAGPRAVHGPGPTGQCLQRNQKV